MSKYNVGDVVKLRDDLDIGEEYGAVDFLYSMKTLKNKALRIDSIDTDDDECVVYEIDGWWISEEMIEGLWEECNQETKLRLIDVLNMIAKGELKEGTKVKYMCFELTYDNEMLINNKGDLYAVILRDMAELNAEVELIEPPCEHEWEIEGIRNGIGDLVGRFRRCVKCGLEEETEDNHFADVGKMVEELDKEEMLCLTLQCAIAVLTDKLNEVINKVNAQTEVILAHRKDIDEIKEQLDY